MILAYPSFCWAFFCHLCLIFQQSIMLMRFHVTAKCEVPDLDFPKKHMKVKWLKDSNFGMMVILDHNQASPKWQCFYQILAFKFKSAQSPSSVVGKVNIEQIYRHNVLFFWNSFIYISNIFFLPSIWQICFISCSLQITFYLHFIPN